MRECIVKLTVDAPKECNKYQIVIYNMNGNIDHLTDQLINIYSNKLTSENRKLAHSGQHSDNQSDENKIFWTYNRKDQILIFNSIFDKQFPTVYNSLQNAYLQQSKDSTDNKKMNNLDSNDYSYFKRLISTDLLNNECRFLNEFQVKWIQEAYTYYLPHFLNAFSLQKCQQSAAPFLQPVNTDLSNNQSTTPRNNFNREEQVTVNQIEVVNYNNHNNDNNVDNNLDNARDDIPLGNNRDWLDNFYTLSRITVLFSILYFYSSPLRFIVVTFLGIIIYLYHNRFFRSQAVIFTDNNDAHIENNNDLLDNGLNERWVLTRRYFNYENNQERPTILSTMWIFFTSFFTSLVPDQPNLL